MAIRYPGGTTVLGTINCSSYSQIIEDLRTNLVNAGWSDQLIKAYVVFTFNGLPGNNETCAVAGRTYRFVNTLSAANDVKIGATAAACASNLYDAINDNEANEGVTYGSGTTIHPDVEAILTAANVVRVRWKASGTGNGFGAWNGLSNVTLDSASGRFGGYYLDSQRTPAGLDMRVYPHWQGNVNEVGIDVQSTDGVLKNPSSSPLLGVAAGRTLHILANRYQYFTWLPNSSAVAVIAHQCGVPYIRDAHQAPVVSSVTSGTGGRYRLTLDRAHGLATGQYVTVAGARGVGNLNGYWQIAVINATTIELIGSAYSDGYEADSARSAGPGQIARAFWYVSAVDNGTSFRVSIGPGNAFSRNWCALNQYMHSPSGGWHVPPRLALPHQAGTTTVPRNWGSYADLLEPRIGWPVANETAEFFWVGELWGAIVISARAPMDVVKYGFDGRNWINYTHDHALGSLWLMLPES